jgi:hypothetical protein
MRITKTDVLLILICWTLASLFNRLMVGHWSQFGVAMALIGTLIGWTLGRWSRAR